MSLIFKIKVKYSYTDFNCSCGSQQLTFYFPQPSSVITTGLNADLVDNYIYFNLDSHDLADRNPKANFRSIMYIKATAFLSAFTGRIGLGWVLLGSHCRTGWNQRVRCGTAMAFPPEGAPTAFPAYLLQEGITASGAGAATCLFPSRMSPSESLLPVGHR